MCNASFFKVLNFPTTISLVELLTFFDFNSSFGQVCQADQFRHRVLQWKLSWQDCWVDTRWTIWKAKIYITFDPESEATKAVKSKILKHAKIEDSHKRIFKNSR